MADASPFPNEHPFDRLQSLLLNLQGLDVVLSELARLATEVVGPTSCGITVRYDANLLTVGSSDARAELLDETQYRNDQGPCLEALRTSRIIDVADAEQDTRWPAYMSAAVEAGMRCSLSLPLTEDGGSPLSTGSSGSTGSTGSSATFGAMNVYGFERAFMFAEPERRQLELFAARAAGTLQVARRLTRDSVLLAQMDEALNSRSVIDQALGIIIAQQHCSASAAFALLRRESQNSRRRLRDIATDLVQRTTGQPPEPGRDFTIT